MSEERVRTATYREPVSQLLALGEAPARAHPWPDYRRNGLDASHAPALIRMATDPALREAVYPAAEFWAPLHAWRALGQLGSVEAVGPLLELLEQRCREGDDWASEELPEVFAMIGPPAVAAIEGFLDDRSRFLWVRLSAARALVQISSAHPALRERCVAVVARQLQSYRHNDEMFNGVIVAHLLDLNAVEAAELIERAFAEGCVDEFCAGDWPEVRYQLGLGPKPQRGGRSLLERFLAAGAAEHGEKPGPILPRPADLPPHTPGPQRKKKRSKRKHARAARKRNRK